MSKSLKNEVIKPIRSISGVTPITVVLKPRKCNHGTCIYCPGGEKVPQSYTEKSPAVLRALTMGFNPYLQVKRRLEALKKMGHPTDKIEIIILGGTFLQYDLDYEYDFIIKCYEAMNGEEIDERKLEQDFTRKQKLSSVYKLKKELSKVKKINETAKHRCVALCIENRPDNCSGDEIKRMLEFGTTRVEIGVQLPDDEIYEKIGRGHTVKDVIDATGRLKNAGFKVGYHFMPGLPYSNPKKDLKLFKKIFSDRRFRPDQLKIYPCQLIKDSPLERFHEKINFKAYTTEQTQQLLQKMFPVIPRYCRVMRVMREIHPEYLISGTTRIDMRKDIEAGLRKRKSKIKEIRYREIGFAINNQEEINQDLKIKITKYSASDGKEYFFEIVNKDDILFGLLRLRIIPRNKAAIIRELHIYGQALSLGEQGDVSQHKGFGKWLMKEAEKIAKKKKAEKIWVISGIGVREYYKKLGYKLEGDYMVKNLIEKNNL